MISWKKATFAGGCFWCMEAAFHKKTKEVISGYTGGTTKNPSYQNIKDHREAVQITFNEKEISYKELLDLFWKSIDPTDPKGQFTDKGNQYKTAIYYHNEKQRKEAEESKKEIQKKFDKPITTEIKPFTAFYKAEEYHQEYYKKNPAKYKLYQKKSGRDKFFKEKN